MTESSAPYLVESPPPPDPSATLDVLSLLAALAARYPNCFPAQGATPKPLKIGIHLDLHARGGLPESVTLKELRAFFRWYTTRFRYRKVLAKGGHRVDLDGQPCGEITEAQATHAKASVTPKDKASRQPPESKPSTPAANPLPIEAPLTEDNSVPGKLEVTVKFNELPKPIQVQGGFKFGLDCDGKPVVVVLKPKLWNKLTTAAGEYNEWIAALTGKMGPSQGSGFVLVEPSLQVFERKPKGEGKTEPAASVPPAPEASPVSAASSAPTSAVDTPAETPVEPPARRSTLGLKNKTDPR